LVHTKTKVTPSEGYFGTKPDLSHLKVFGSWVCVKRSGDRSGKLDCNNFTGIFLRFTVTNHNIRYLDLEFGLVKCSHHKFFHKVWYLQPSRPPATQLLYDLGLEVDPEDDPKDLTTTLSVPWPPLPTCNPPSDKFLVPLPCTLALLPLQETLVAHHPLTAAAEQTHTFDKFPHAAAMAA
jgi:hypothetical protein